MVVDDDPVICETIRERLGHYGWSITTAAHGAAALDLATKDKPDVILLDIRMPVMDGHTTLDRIRQDAALHDVPVIIVTASDHAGDIGRAASHGIAEYVTKPFYAADLAASVENVLRTHGKDGAND
jgi:CheY-like chemotaxis protein